MEKRITRAVLERPRPEAPTPLVSHVEPATAEREATP
jgi:hypothetical protein